MHASPALRDFAQRLRGLPQRDSANTLLWLAVEGQIDLCADGRIGVWVRDPAVLDSPQAEFTLEPSGLLVQAGDAGPGSEAAAWCAVDPKDVMVLVRGRNQVWLTVSRLERLLRVDAEDVAG